MRPAFFVAPVVLAMMTAIPAHAAEQRYSASAFQAAQAAGKPIVVDVTATWCPTCQEQKPIIHSLANDPKYKDFVVFAVDFDKEKKALRKFNAQQQSTIIVYKGQKECARSIGDTNKTAIRQLFDKAS